MDAPLLIEAMIKNFKRVGYYDLEIRATLFAPIPILYRVEQAEVVAFALVNEVSEHIWTQDESRQLTQYTRQLFLDKGAGKVTVCMVFLAERLTERHMEGTGFDPFWLIDCEKLRLVIYENQPGDLLDAHEILERTLQGEVFLVKSSRFPFLTVALFLLNIGVFFYMKIVGCTFSANQMIEAGAIYPLAILQDGEIYRLFSYMFLHFDIEHLMNNMISLCVLGYYLELAIGRFPFLLVYLGGGVGAGAISYAFHLVGGQEYAVSAGASGAIFAIMGGLLADALVNRKLGRQISVPRMILFVALGLYSGFASKGVDNAAHIGGLFVGFFLMLLIELILTKEGREFE